MTTVTDILRAIERRAERALVQELRIMTREILDLRTQITLEERAHADALLLKLDHLERCQQVTPIATTEPPPIPSLRLADPTSESTCWLVHFYSHDAGDLERVLLTDSLATALQIARNGLDDAQHAVAEVVREAACGDISVLAPDGVVLASIRACTPHAPPIDADVRIACAALELDDATGLAKLFVRERAAA